MRSNETPPGRTQQRIIWFALTTLAITAVAAIGILAIWGIGKVLDLLSPVLWPLAIATVLAYLLDPAVNWLERQKISRTWGITIVFTVVFAIVAGVLASVIPQMIKETNNLVKKIPAYTAQAQQRLTDWANRAEKEAIAPPPPTQDTNAPAATNSPPDFSPASAETNVPSGTNSSIASLSKTNAPSAEVTRNIHQIHNQIINSASDWTGKLFSTIGAWLLTELAKATALLDVIVALILIPIYTFYFLSEKRWIRTHWTNYLPISNVRVKEEIIFILVAINQYMIAFFRGQVLVSICSGILYTIGFLCIGLDYAFLLGFLCMLLTMVPFLGSLVNFIVAMVLTIMQFGDWTHPLLILLIFTIVVSAENFFYSPRIMGNRVGMHPLVIIVAVMIGITLLGGLLGGVLAIPLAAALRVVMVRYFWKPNGTTSAKSSASNV
jgi:predicted PurR-regulated permease PerM